MRFHSIAGLLLALCFSTATHAAWLPQTPPTADTSFRAIRAVDANVVWIGGSKGTCLRTRDGGGTWERLPVPAAESLDFRGIAAFDDQTAILVSAGEASDGKARIYRTIDGGAKWTLVFETMQKGAFLDGVAFWDRQHGLVFGDPVDGAWYLLRTSDGGETWKRIPPGSLPPMLPHEAAFAASNSSLVVRGKSHAWIASGGAERARVFHSTDRGETWQVTDTPMPSGPTAGIFGLYFYDLKHGIGIGGDHKQEHRAGNNVIQTMDGGRSWQRGAPTDPTGLKEALVTPSATTWLAVGPSGTSMSSDRGRSWQKVDTLVLHAASCAQGHCWAAGKGVIAKWQ